MRDNVQAETAARHAAEAVIVAQTDVLIAQTRDFETMSTVALRALREHAAEFDWRVGHGDDRSPAALPAPRSRPAC